MTTPPDPSPAAVDFPTWALRHNDAGHGHLTHDGTTWVCACGERFEGVVSERCADHPNAPLELVCLECFDEQVTKRTETEMSDWEVEQAYWRAEHELKRRGYVFDHTKPA
jgi:hypothetical protein